MLTDRTKFVYDCVIIDAETQNPEAYVVETYWDPSKDFVTSDSVAVTAAAEATVASKRKYLAVSAQQREADVVEIDAS